MVFFILTNNLFNQINTQAKNSVWLPSIKIESFTAVPKGRSIDVIVSINPSNSPVTLTLRSRTGEGEARFKSNNSKVLSIQNNGTISIEGVEPSSKAGNMELIASIDDKTLAKVQFSVIWVTLSIRTEGEVSKFNSARKTFSKYTGNQSLGFRFLSSRNYVLKWATAVEIMGEVIPSDFKEPIILARKRSYAKYINNYTEPHLLKADVWDTDDNLFRDDIAADSNGKIFDLVAPYLGTSDIRAIGAINRIRNCFHQFAVYGGVLDEHTGEVLGGIKVSDDYHWFSYISVTKMSHDSKDDQPNYDISGDNCAGYGKGTLKLIISSHK